MASHDGTVQRQGARPLSSLSPTPGPCWTTVRDGGLLLPQVGRLEPGEKGLSSVLSVPCESWSALRPLLGDG
jgi:hypothetical protein